MLEKIMPGKHRSPKTRSIDSTRSHLRLDRVQCGSAARVFANGGGPPSTGRSLLGKNRCRLLLFLFLGLTACGGTVTENLSGPRVVETDPVPEATGVPLSAPIQATFSSRIDPVTINKDTFILTGVSGEVTYQNQKAIFTPSIPFANETTYHAVLTTGIKDLDGIPLSTNYIWSFSTGTGTGGGGSDQGPPAIVSTSPEEGATNVAIDAPIRVVFSESILPETLRSDTFFIQGISGRIRYDDPTRTATLQPLAPLTLQTRYQVTVTTGITDRTGTPLDAGRSWSFTTASTVDTSPPSIVSTLPGDQENGVAVNTAVKAIFSKEISPESLQGRFILQDPGGREIGATLGFDPGSLAATLTPTGPLQPETPYQAIVRSGVADLSGRLLPADVRWSFTTGGSEDRIRPTVIERRPAGRDVPLDSVVTVRFSEPINPETLAGHFMITSGGRAVPGEIRYDVPSQTATLTPSRLRYGTDYTTILTHDIKDLAGNRLEHTSWSWKTVQRPD
ncbi:MAG: hypothetical protein EPO39_14075 [Candidatus Manganitrophaceae bacterium]|nr:MAG: hypothetical protein EPO39_14075 [Candidatus Manganitrophaceae bacterium]